MVYHQADTSTFRYRCYNPFQATKKSQEWQCVYFFLTEAEMIMRLLPKCHLLVFSRLQWEHSLDVLAGKARALHIPILFDIDDLVFDLRYLRLVTNTLNVHFGSHVDYDFWTAYFSRIGMTAELADGFTTTNSFLGERLTEKYGKPYQIVVNSLNEEQLQISELCRKKKQKKKSIQPYTIGYFSGTPSHINDFKVICPEMMELLRNHQDMVLRVVGFMDFPPALQDYMRSGRIRFTPLVDFLELQQLIAGVDVNVVPLVNNTFTNCKSELKFFEAAAVGTVTAATPTFTYSHAIEDGVSGFLCEPGQWYDRIEGLYNQPETAEKMVKEAWNLCSQNYSPEKLREQLETAYHFFA